MRRLKQEFHNRAFYHFLLAGGTAAGVNFFSRLGLGLVLDYTWAIVAAYACGMLTAFLLNRYLVFGGHVYRHATHRQVLYFVLVNLFGLLQTLLVSLLLARWLLPWLGVTCCVESLAHLAGIGVPVFTSFLGHKYLTFRTHPLPPARRETA